MTEDVGEQKPKKPGTRYWSNLAVANISTMRLNKEAGLLSKREGWRNVVEHELVEAEAVGVLAERLGLSNQQASALRTAALLHDVYKRKEAEKAEKEGPSGFDASVKDQSDWLRSMGYSEEIIILTESVGHTSLEEFTRDFDSMSTARKIMHYVDDITLDNDLVLLDDRMDYIDQNPKYKELNQEGIKIFGRPYFQVQREVSKRIEHEFASALGISDPSQVPLFIKSIIEQRINP